MALRWMSLKCHYCVGLFIRVRPQLHSNWHTQKDAWRISPHRQHGYSLNDCGTVQSWILIYERYLAKYLCCFFAVFLVLNTLVLWRDTLLLCCLIHTLEHLVFSSGWPTVRPRRRGCGLQWYSSLLDDAIWCQQCWRICHQVSSC